DLGIERGVQRSSRLDRRGAGINPPVTTVRVDKGKTGIDEGLYSTNGQGSLDQVARSLTADVVILLPGGKPAHLHRWWDPGSKMQDGITPAQRLLEGLDLEQAGWYGVCTQFTQLRGVFL